MRRRVSGWGFAVHDLRSPLFAIDACCAEVAAGLVDWPTESVEGIRGAVNRMREELDAWLEAERRGQTNTEVHPGSTDMGRLVADVEGLNQPAARAKSLALVGGDSGPEPLVARLDPWRWREVVDNLVSNAIKFLPAGGSLSVELRRTDDRGSIRVRDQGLGISAADREQWFGAYERLWAQPTGGGSSTGLGPHLVKRLVEAPQGELTVTDGVDGDAIFEVSVALELSAVGHV
jgi:signal transduction histidine kinase